MKITEEQLTRLKEIKRLPERLIYLRMISDTPERAKFASALGISRQYIYYLENGRYKPSLDIVLKYVNYFDININDLLKIKGSKR